MKKKMSSDPFKNLSRKCVLKSYIAQLAGAVEYADCFSGEE